MATTQKWTAIETPTTALATSTDMDSLADGSLTAAGAAIDNTSGLYQYVTLEIVLGSINPSGTPYVDCYLFASQDGTNYEDVSASAAHAIIASAFVTTGSSAKRAVLRNIPIPPIKFKLCLRNRTGVSFAASGNTFKYARHYEQSV